MKPFLTNIVIRPKGKLMAMLPHYLLIDGQLVGVMKGKQVTVNMPSGHHSFTVRSMYKFIESTVEADLIPDKTLLLTFGDRERVWNWLFNVDLALWIVKRFVHLPDPWGLVYEVVSNGFFAIWLLRVWLIRKHYFSMELSRL